jgi:hypothetical protein
MGKGYNCSRLPLVFLLSHKGEVKVSFSKAFTIEGGMQEVLYPEQNAALEILSLCQKMASTSSRISALDLFLQHFSSFLPLPVSCKFLRPLSCFSQIRRALRYPSYAFLYNCTKRGFYVSHFNRVSLCQ